MKETVDKVCEEANCEAFWVLNFCDLAASDKLPLHGNLVYSGTKYFPWGCSAKEDFLGNRSSSLATFNIRASIATSNASFSHLGQYKKYKKQLSNCRK